MRVETSRRYYSQLVLAGRDGTPSICEAAKDRARAMAKTLAIAA